MTEAGEEAFTLNHIPYIKYLVQFWKDKINNMQVLVDSKNKVNTIHSNYIKMLSLLIWKTDVRAQKIDKSYLEPFGMVITKSQVKDKLGRSCVF